MKNLLLERIHQLVELRFLVGRLVGMDHAVFGGLVKLAGANFQKFGGSGGVAGSDRGAELLFKGFHGALAGAVAGVGGPAGTHPFDRGLQMCHLVLAFRCN